MSLRKKTEKSYTCMSSSNFKEEKNISSRSQKTASEKGYALLEYCAGAAIIAGVIWVALTNLGGSLEQLLASLSDWAIARSGEIGG